MTCVGRLPSPLPRRYRRCASFTLLFTLPTFRSPRRRHPTPLFVPLINLLGTPRPPSPLSLFSSIPTCRCILREPRSIPYQPVRRRAFFRALGEARKHDQRRIDGGGGGGSKNRDSSSLRCAAARRARFPMRSPSIALLYSADRDYIGRVNGSGRKDYGFAEVFRVISMISLLLIPPGLRFALIEELETVAR